MNVIHGVDITFYMGHHRGGHLGNVADKDESTTVPALPTLDQVLAWSPSFYPDTTTILERSLVIGQGGMSSGWSSPTTGTGSVQHVSAEGDSLRLFDRIFVPDEDPGQIRPPIVDRVIDDYRRLRDSNRRLSAADRQRLEEHIARLDELQRKLNVVVSCGDIPRPGTSSSDLEGGGFGIDPARQAEWLRLMNDVIAAAFACDTSRIATVFTGAASTRFPFSTFSGDWHADIVHNCGRDTAAQAEVAAAAQRFFAGMFVDLVAKLDAIDDGNGSTVLDNCLVQWTQEAGAITHEPISIPLITAGSACGFFRTGSYVDLRDRTREARPVGKNGYLAGTRPGLIYNQWLGNVARSMGLTPAEYEVDGNGGYGRLHMSPSGESWYSGYGHYGNPEVGALRDNLPYVT